MSAEKTCFCVSTLTPWQVVTVSVRLLITRPSQTSGYAHVVRLDVHLFSDESTFVNHTSLTRPIQTWHRNTSLDICTTTWHELARCNVCRIKACHYLFRHGPEKTRTIFSNGFPPQPQGRQIFLHWHYPILRNKREQAFNIRPCEPQCPQRS